MSSYWSQEITWAVAFLTGWVSRAYHQRNEWISWGVVFVGVIIFFWVTW